MQVMKARLRCKGALKSVFDDRKWSSQRLSHIRHSSTENCLFWCYRPGSEPFQIITKDEHTKRLEMSNSPLFSYPRPNPHSPPTSPTHTFNSIGVSQVHFSTSLLSPPPPHHPSFSAEDGEGEAVVPAMSRLEKAYPR